MAWVLAALSAPLCHLAGITGWAEVAVAGVLCTWLSVERFRQTDEITVCPKWFAASACICLVLVTGVCLDLAGSTWPTGDTTSIVPIVLLLLAVWSAWEGAEKASRTGSVLMWLLLLLFAAVVAGGIGNVKLSRIELSGRLSNGLVFLVFLLPGVAKQLPIAKGQSKLLWILPGFSALIAFLVKGTLSEPVAGAMVNPFYEFGKSLSLFGVVERYESLVSVALTIGYFCLLSMLLSSAYHLSESIYEGKGRQGVILTALGSVWVMIIPIKSYHFPALLLLIAWFVMPAVRNILVKKTVEKRRK